MAVYSTSAIPRHWTRSIVNTSLNLSMLIIPFSSTIPSGPQQLNTMSDAYNHLLVLENQRNKHYSWAWSHYCLTLLSTALLPSTRSALISQTDQLKLPPTNYDDARLSANNNTITYHNAKYDNPQTQTSHLTMLQSCWTMGQHHHSQLNESGFYTEFDQT